VERRVIFSPEAAIDLSNIYEYIAKQSGPTRAIGYINGLSEDDAEEQSVARIERSEIRGDGIVRTSRNLSIMFGRQ
jgi:plasmid stabilization system protein ParE